MPTDPKTEDMIPASLPIMGDLPVPGTCPGGIVKHVPAHYHADRLRSEIRMAGRRGPTEHKDDLPMIERS